MENKIGKCPICGENSSLIPSNNPLVAPVCLECLNKNVKIDDLEEVNIFCRTFNLPFDPDLWLKMRKEFQQKVFKEYASFFFDEENNTYKDTDRNL